jgi:hypothetical protein
MLPAIAKILLIFSVSHASESQRLDDIESRLLDVEIHTQRDKIHLSGQLDNVVQWERVDRSNQAPYRNVEQSYITEFRLKSFASPLPRWQIYTTIGAGYNWNNNFVIPSVVTEDGQASLKGSYLWVEKAYFDYSVFKNMLKISVGRLPTQLGPPAEYQSGDERLGTYPLLSYSVPLDGAAITWKINKTFNFSDRLVLRGIFSPFGNEDTKYFYTPTSSGNERIFRNNATEMGGGYFLTLEYGTHKIPFIEDFKFFLQGFHAKFSRMKSVEARGLLTDTFRGALSSPYFMDRNVYEIGSTSRDLAQVNVFVAHMELNRPFGSNFDFYSTFKKSWFDKRGSLTAVVVEDHSSVPGFGVGTEVDLGGFIYSNDEEATGVLIGGRYTFLEKINLGLEYLKQNHGLMPTALRAPNPTSFYTTLGKGYHAYLNYNIHKYLAKIRLGYFKTYEESTFSSFSYVSNEQNKDIIYSQLVLRF